LHARHVAVLLYFVLIGVTAGCRLGPAADRQPPLFRAAYTSAVDIGDLPSLIAHRQLENAGYRVEETFYAQPELAVEALASGAADVASGGTRAFWAAAGKGAEAGYRSWIQLGRVPLLANASPLHVRGCWSRSARVIIASDRAWSPRAR
jgi:hypothetical protein